MFLQADANTLEGLAVQYRYPGMSAEKSVSRLFCALSISFQHHYLE
jgi:hypothetical protein